MSYSSTLLMEFLLLLFCFFCITVTLTKLDQSAHGTDSLPTHTLVTYSDEVICIQTLNETCKEMRVRPLNIEGLTASARMRL